MISPPTARIRRSTAHRRATMSLVASVLVGTALTISACGGGAASSSKPSSDDSTVATTAPTAGAGPTSYTAEVHLEPVITGLDDPVAVAARPGRNQLWIAERSGRIRVVDRTTTWNIATGAVERSGYTVTPKPVLDLSSIIDPTASGDSRGLFDLAFSSDGQSLIVDHAASNGDTVIARYTIVDQMDYRTDVTLTTDAGAWHSIDGSTTTSTSTTTTRVRPDERTTASTITPGPIPRPMIDPSTRTVLLTIPAGSSPASGGRLVLAPDGYLVIGVPGPGPRADTADDDPIADDPNSLLGKLLRIDISGAAGTASGSGVADPGTEARGATSSGADPYVIPDTNPYASGGGAREVWRIGVADPTWFTFDRRTGDLQLIDGLRRVRPARTTGAAEGAPRECVVGGYIYRGAAVTGLGGVEVYADRCTGELRGRLARNDITLDDHRLATAGDGASIVAFGQDDQGELHVVSSDGVLSVIMEGR